MQVVDSVMMMMTMMMLKTHYDDKKKMKQQILSKLCLIFVAKFKLGKERHWEANQPFSSNLNVVAGEKVGVGESQ